MTTTYEQVIAAVLAASSGISGLLLVFLGLALSAYQGFAADTPPRVRARYRRAAVGVLAAFGLGVVCVTLCLWWLLLVHPAHSFFVLTVALFFALLASLLGAAIFSVYRLLK